MFGLCCESVRAPPRSWLTERPEAYQRRTVRILANRKSAPVWMGPRAEHLSVSIFSKVEVGVAYCQTSTMILCLLKPEAP
jgi:hypothetical protein